MIPFKSIVIILAIHTIFDFFLQSRKMAEGKSELGSALFKHLAVYLVGLILMTVSVSIRDVFPFILINLILHGITDGITSNISKYFYQKDEAGYFFNTIGVDQFVHIITLLGVFVACNL